MNIESAKRVLHNHLLAIKEIPGRVNRLDVITVKELIVYLDELLDKSRADICGQISRIDQEEHRNPNYTYQYPDKFLPDKLFEYWARKMGGYGFSNYEDINELRRIVADNLDSRADKNLPIKESGDEFEYVFREGGYELFKYFNKKYNPPKDKMLKFSSIYKFMFSHENALNSIKCNREDYRKFVNDRIIRLSKLIPLHESSYNKNERFYYDDRKESYYRKELVPLFEKWKEQFLEQKRKD